MMHRLFIALVALLLALPAAAQPAAPAIEALPEAAPAWLAGYRVRYALRVVGDPVQPPLAEGTPAPEDGSTPPWPQHVLARIPTGGWLKGDGSDLTVQNAAGEAIPAAVLSHDPRGDTIIQFKASGADKWYWVYAVNPAGGAAKAEPAPEGLVAEFRQWEGDLLDDWASVLEGLEKSENVIGNAVVAEVIQNMNPARPGDPRNFAASYRGHLWIQEPGTYRLMVNGDDACFLFIDGFKVYERAGQNVRLTGRLPIKDVGADIELTAGVHRLEVHQVVGNNPQAGGFCSLIWIPPGQTNWAFVPRGHFVHALFAEVAAIEQANGAAAATFAWGVDDSLDSGSQTLYLARFEAQGPLGDSRALRWDFGDGTTGRGRSVTKVYFAPGEYTVTLQAGGGMPPHRRRVFMWPAPAPTSPLSLGKAVETLAASDWKALDVARILQMFDFLSVCEQPTRWPLMEAVARHLLGQGDLDPQLRAELYAALIRSLAEQNRAAEGLRLVDPAIAEFASLPSLQVGVKLAAARIYARHLKQPEDANRYFASIIEEHRRLDHPNVRRAAIEWGDLHAEVGDLAKAAETYRLAGTLGGEDFKGSSVTDAMSRGAMLRVVEQKLRSGEVQESRRLLEKIELDFPEQKLEGLYRFLRAEADRAAGRYEEAIRGYELLLRMSQWGSFKDRTLHGLADTYYRMDELDESLDWFAALRESYPDYFEERKLDETVRVIEGRAKRLAAAAGDAAAVSFGGFATSFEPQEKENVGTLTAFAIVPALGFGGAHVGQVEGVPVYKGYQTYVQRLRNLTSHGWYWVEVWYRESMEGSVVTAQPHVHAWLYGTGNDLHPRGNGTAYYDRSYGQWRKLAFKLRAPVTQDGRIEMSLRHLYGSQQIDSISVMPITDRQNDALFQFIEGAPAE